MIKIQKYRTKNIEQKKQNLSNMWIQVDFGRWRETGNQKMNERNDWFQGKERKMCGENMAT